VDFGALDAERVFEAHGVLPPVAIVADSARRHRAHAPQFLHAHGVDPSEGALPLLRDPG
jgi:hypothetical protein